MTMLLGPEGMAWGQETSRGSIQPPKIWACASRGSGLMPNSPHLPLFLPVSYSGLPTCLPVMAPQTQNTYRLKARSYCKDYQARPLVALSWVQWMMAKPWYHVDGSVIIISSFVSMGLDWNVFQQEKKQHSCCSHGLVFFSKDWFCTGEKPQS